MIIRLVCHCSVTIATVDKTILAGFVGIVGTGAGALTKLRTHVERIAWNCLLIGTIAARGVETLSSVWTTSAVWLSVAIGGRCYCLDKQNKE